MSLNLGGNSTLGFRTTCNITELKHQLTDHLIYSKSCIEAVPSQGSLRYTRHFSSPNFDLEESWVHLCLMVEIITSSRYLFLNKVILMHLSLLASLDLEQIINTWWTNVFIKLILHLHGQNDPHWVYEPVNILVYNRWSLYTKMSLLYKYIKKWKAVAVLKFVSEHQHWVMLVDYMKKGSALQPWGKNNKSVIYIPFIKYWLVGDFKQSFLFKTKKNIWQCSAKRTTHTDSIN